MARQSLKGLDKGGINDAFSVADKVTDLAPQRTPDLNLAARPGLELDGQDRVAAETVRELRDGYAEPDTFAEPTFGDLIGAAFRTENTVGSAIANIDVSRARNVDSPELSPEAAVDRAYKDGFGDHAGLLGKSRTEAEYEANRDALAREIEDRRLLEAAGFFGSFVPIAAAAILDLPTLLPGGAIVKGGATVARTAASVAGAAVADATITEAALQSTQRLRTPLESASNIAMSAVLGGVIGGVAGGVAGRFGADVSNKIDARSQAANSPEGFAKARGLGAAAVAEWDGVMATPSFTKSQLDTIEFKTLDFVDAQAPRLGWIGDAIRNPRRSLENGMTPTEREFANQIAANPRITPDDVAGNVTAPSETFASAHGEISGRSLDFVHDAEKTWKEVKQDFKGNKEEFGKEVALAVVRDEPHPDPRIEALAKNFRAKVSNPIKDELIANGQFKEDLEVANADHYMPIIYDGQAIMKDRDAFLEFEAADYAAVIRDENATARSANATRNKAAQAELDRVRADLNQVALERKENLRTLTLNRKTALEKFDKEAPKELAEPRKKRDDVLASLRKERDAEIVETREARDEMLKGDLTPTQRSRIRTSGKTAITKLTRDYAKKLAEAEKDYLKSVAKVEKRLATERAKLNQKFDELVDGSKRAVSEAEAAVKASKELPPANKTIQFKTEGDIRAEAYRRAEELYKSVTGQRRFTLDHEVGAGLANYRKPRKNPARHENLITKGWVKTDILDITEHMTRTAGTDAALGRVFKKEVVDLDADGKPILDANGKRQMKMIGDTDLSVVIKGITDEYQVLLDNVALTRSQERAVSKLAPDLQDARRAELRAKNEVDLTNKRDRAIRNVEVLKSLIRGGSSNTSDGSNWNEVAEVLGLFNYMRLMGGVILSSLGDPINIMMANGFARTLREGLMPMFKDFDGAFKNADGDARRVTRLLMQNVEREMNKTVMDIMDLGNPMARDGSTVNFMRKAANHFSHLTGITAWNSFWRQVAGRTVQARVLENAIKGFDNLSPSEKAWLTNNRITPKKLEAVREAYDAQTVKVLPDGGVYPDLDKWPKDAVDTLRQIAFNEQSGNVVAPQFVDKMAMSATPMGRLIGQFRSHMFANQVRLIGRNRQLAMLDKEKAGQVYTGLGMIVAMGLVVDYVKHATGDVTFDGSSKTGTGESSHEKWLKQFEANPFNTTFNALDRSGVFGIMMEADNILDKTMGLGVRASGRSVFGDEMATGSSRMKERGVFDTLLGPSVGLVEDTLGAAQAFKHILQEGEMSRNDFKTLRRVLPGQNVWLGIQQTLNEGEKQVGNLYDWQEPRQ